MAKPIEDIIAGEKKSIRDIPIPENRRKNLNVIDTVNIPESRPTPPSYEEPVSNYSPLKTEPQSSVGSAFNPPPKPVARMDDVTLPRVQIPQHKDFSPSISTGNKFKLPRKSILIGTILGGIILALGIFSLFGGATVTYTPKTQSISFNNEKFTASKEGQPGDLLFSVIKISDERSVEAPANGEEAVSQKASGVIVVYNNSSAAPQRLIKNTRFETPDGKIYRIQNDITVPGQKTVSGTKSPGSLEVTVFADQPGDTYNIGLSDFTLPGLKGDPKFTTIYARSKTPITGGMIGTVKKVSEEDKASAKTEIEKTLNDSLLAEAKAQVPNDFILIPSLIQISFEPSSLGTSTSDKATVKERGNFSGVIFKKSDLIHYLATKKTTLGPSENVDANVDNLQISFTNPDAASVGDLASLDTLGINISGDTMLVWISNEDGLKKDLIGKNKTQLSEVLKNYPSILKADAVVRPFWKSSFPTDPTKIKLVKEI